MRRVFILMSMAALLAAHHSLDATYDRAAETEYKATVRSVTFQNPHATFTAMVGTREWVFEMGAPTRLMQDGWTRETLRPNDVVTVTAWPAKDGSAHGAARRLVWADGRTMESADAGMWAPREK